MEGSEALKERGMTVLEMAIEAGIEGEEELKDAQNILKAREGKGGATNSDGS